MIGHSKQEKNGLPFFAYGTLLPGQPNYYIWGDAIAYQQKAELADGRLYSLGYYPMLVEAVGGSVKGALVGIKGSQHARVMAALDMLEGYDPDNPEECAYRRLVKRVVLEDGRQVAAWVYVGDIKYVKNDSIIDDGDWVRFASAGSTEMESWWQTIDSVKGLQESKE